MDQVSEEAAFLFDLQGYLLLRGVLTTSECASLLSTLQRLEEEKFPDSWLDSVPEDVVARPTRETKIGQQLRLNGMPILDPVFDLLIAHPTITPYLHAFMGDPQLINTWSISKKKDSKQGGWHRGVPTTDYSYDRGMIRTRMLNTVYFLTDNGLHDGSMMALPGSHKSNLDLKWSEHDGLEMPGSVPVIGAPGDVLIFSEALLHNGMDKTTDGIRSNLYYNYVHAHYHVAMREPGNIHHFYFPEKIRARLTPEQREMTRWMEFTRCP